MKMYEVIETLKEALEYGNIDDVKAGISYAIEQLKEQQFQLSYEIRGDEIESN